MSDDYVPGTGVSAGTQCLRCGITAAESVKLPAVPTGIDHPVYCATRSFYRYSGGDHTGQAETYACPRCHREIQLEKLFQLMDARARKE